VAKPDDDDESETIRHIIYVAEPADTNVPYGVLTQYDEHDPINAVGAVVRFEITEDQTDSKSTLETNDNLSCIWASPQGNLWVGSADGRIWTTSAVKWNANDISGLEWESRDPKFEWKGMELPRRRGKKSLNAAAISGSSDQDVYVGTFDGSILHWDGKSWTHSSTENTDSIQRMHGTGPKDQWAVGRNGVVLHYDGRAWKRLALPGDAGEENLTGVWASSADEVHICSTSGAIYTGSRNGLSRLGDYSYEFYGIVEFGGTMYLAGGDDGALVLKGNKVDVARDTFDAAGVYRLNQRLSFVQPIQEEPAIVVHDPKSKKRPWMLCETG
jgi:hypothetical protein